MNRIKRVETVMIPKPVSIDLNVQRNTGGIHVKKNITLTLLGFLERPVYYKINFKIHP